MTKRIAVFQYDCPLQSYTRDLLVKLREEGYVVSFLSYDAIDRKLVDSAPFENVGVDVRVFEDIGKVLFRVRKRWGLLASNVYRRFFWHYHVWYVKQYLKMPLHLLDMNVLTQSFRFIKKESSFDYFIGIEKEGLIWASLMAEKTGVPVIYYSLELYLEDVLHLPGFIKYQKFRESEKRYHSRAVATIIQDTFRAEALFIGNGVRTPVILTPVSVRGEVVTSRSKYFQNKFGLSENQIVLLYFGLFIPQRFCEEIILAGNALPEKYVTVFHGYGDEPYIQFLQSMAQPGRIFFSLDMVDESEISALLSSAHIGLALYENQFLNDRLTAFSSQKIALFARHGLPFIAMRNECYEYLTQNIACCVLVDNPSQIPEAAAIMATDISRYRNNAWNAYRKYYDYDVQFESLRLYLNQQ